MPSHISGDGKTRGTVICHRYSAAHETSLPEVPRKISLTVQCSVQVRVLQAQLAAKHAALAELDVLADAAGAAAAQNSVLSTELADKARALADQERKIAAMRDQVFPSNAHHMIVFFLILFLAYI